MRDHIRLAAVWVHARITVVRADPERGEITTTVIVTALLAIAAVTIITIIVTKLIAKANSIDLGLGD